jgi:hypothetical protein
VSARLAPNGSGREPVTFAIFRVPYWIVVPRFAPTDSAIMKTKKATGDHHRRELAVHGLAFCVAAVIGAIVLHRFYGILERETDSARDALQVYLAWVFIAGGFGPAVTLTLFWLTRRIRSLRNRRSRL